jgi:isopentenyl phosphate kinase
VNYITVLRDETQGCSILSGDLIISHLSEKLKPKYVTFLTDVDGVFNEPPLGNPSNI